MSAGLKNAGIGGTVIRRRLRILLVLFPLYIGGLVAMNLWPGFWSSGIGVATALVLIAIQLRWVYVDREISGR